MIQPNVIKDLTKLENSPFPILSVYLGEDSKQAPSSELLTTQFHSLVHKLTNDQRAEFKSDIAKIEKYLHSYTPSYRSLVFFSAGDNLWQVANLEFAMPAKITVSNSPDLESLIKSLESHSKYLVLLVDREKARMFTVEQGEIIEKSEFVGDPIPQKKKSTGRDSQINQADTNSRRDDNNVKKHIETIAKSVAKFTNANDISFVIVGGHADMFRKVADALPTSLQSKVVVGFVTDINLPLAEIMRQSKKVAATIS